MALPSAIIQRGTRAAQTTPTAGQAGILYYVTDEQKTERWSGTAWESFQDAGAGAILDPGTVTDNAIVRWDGTSGAAVQDTSTLLVADTGAITFPDNVRQTFNPGADASGLNVGALAGNPGTPSDADVWYNSSTGRMMARINSATVGAGCWFIEEITPSATGTLTFSSLGSFTHLEIRWSARSDKAAVSAEDLTIRFNSDTGSNYDSELLYNSTGTAAAAFEAIGGSSGIIGLLPAATATASRGAAGTIRINDYRGTTFHKSVEADVHSATTTSSGSIVTRLFGVTWRDASAITSITLFLGSGNFVSGSKFTLYGYS